MASRGIDGNELVSPVCKFLAFVSGLTASCCFVYMTVTPCWYVTFAEASISPYENCYGLWKYCSSTGLCGKWLSGSLLGAHGTRRTVCRGFMISACLLSGFAMLLNIFGMKCVLLFRLSKKTKEILTKRSAFLWLVSGTFSLTCSTWYGLFVMHSAWDEDKPIELSDAIFVGWGSAGFSYASSVLLWVGAIVSKRNRKRKDKPRGYVLSTVSTNEGDRRVSNTSRQTECSACQCHGQMFDRVGALCRNHEPCNVGFVEPAVKKVSYESFAKMTYM